MEQTSTLRIPRSVSFSSLTKLTRGRLVLLALVIAAGYWLFHRGGTEAVYRTEPVEQGDMLVTIEATGTVEPVEVIDVGAQVAGMVSSFGTDKNGKTVDYGSEVEEGSILAQIDDALYKAESRRADAELQAARAQMLQAQAKLIQTERDWNRAQKMGSGSALAQSSYDAYEAAYKLAQAETAVADGKIAQAEAAQDKARRNLDFTTIRAPVRGVIIDRRVNIGQTVVASLNAPSLFLIAKDLRQMQVWVSVNEADIGNVFPGQNVTFTVSAKSGRIFKGTVGKIRLNASMNQNVVTYVVEVNTDNSSGDLLPYLTADVRFEVNNLKNALLVPNAALRWIPPAEPAGEKSGRREKPAPPSEAAKDLNLSGQDETIQGKVWRLAGSGPEAVTVKILGSDGRRSAIASPALQPGDSLIIGQSEADAGSATAGTNPFVPKMPRGGRRAGAH